MKKFFIFKIVKYVHIYMSACECPLSGITWLRVRDVAESARLAAACRTELILNTFSALHRCMNTFTFWATQYKRLTLLSIFKSSVNQTHPRPLAMTYVDIAGSDSVYSWMFLGENRDKRGLGFLFRLSSAYTEGTGLVHYACMICEISLTCCSDVDTCIDSMYILEVRVRMFIVKTTLIRFSEP